MALLVAVLVFPFILAMSSEETHYNHLASSVIKRSVSFTLTLVQVSSFLRFLGAGSGTCLMFEVTIL